MGRGPFNSSKKMIRLALHGCTNRPFYHVVLMWNRAPRNNRPLENLGYYDPLTNVHGEKVVALKFSRIQELYSMKNVEISTPVLKLLGLAGFLPIHPKTSLEAYRAQKKMQEDLENLERESVIDTDTNDSSTSVDSDFSGGMKNDEER